MIYQTTVYIFHCVMIVYIETLCERIYVEY
jgi:hypothetical protein